MWEVTNAKTRLEVFVLQTLYVLIMLMACVSKKVFIALEIISEHTKKVLNFPA